MTIFTPFIWFFSGIFILWSLFWMLFDISIVMLIRTLKKLGTLFFSSFSIGYAYYRVCLNNLRNSDTYQEWIIAATSIDELRGSTLWRQDNNSEDYDATLLEQSFFMLRRLRISVLQQHDYHASSYDEKNSKRTTDTTDTLHSTPSSSSPSSTDPLDTLFFHLTPMIARNYCGIENYTLYQNSLLGTKYLIEKFIKEIIRCLDLLVSTLPLTDEEIMGYNKNTPKQAITTSTTTTITGAPYTSPSLVSLHHLLQQRIEYVDKLRLQLGRSSLSLSGGGAFALASLGIVRTLLEHGLLPKVISGTSGGSLVAALMAIHSDEVLIKYILVPEIILHDRYIQNVCNNEAPNSTTTTDVTTLPRQFFDDFGTQFYRFMYTSITGTYPYFMNPELFMASLRVYLKDITFEEAFHRTGRIVNIPVVASMRTMDSTAYPTSSSSTIPHSSKYQHQHTFVLNYLTAPHVLLRSAVAASCALPGVLPPTVLQAKNKYGHIVNFHTVGVQTIDGSLKADIPFHEMSLLFHVRNVIVAQCNPHITLFLSSSKHENYTTVSPYSPAIAPSSSVYHHQSWGFLNRYRSSFIRGSSRSIGQHSLMYRSLTLIEDWLRQDILNRTKSLAYLRLLPKWFGGWDMHGIFLQTYTGNITIIPRQPFLSLWKAFTQPSVKDMENYILHGSRATYPHLAHIRSTIAIESKLAECSRKLHQQYEQVTRLLHAESFTSVPLHPTTVSTDTDPKSSGSGTEITVPSSAYHSLGLPNSETVESPPHSVATVPTLPTVDAPVSNVGPSKYFPSSSSIFTQFSHSNKYKPFPVPLSTSSPYISLPSTVAGEPMRVISYSIPKNLTGGMEEYFTNPFFTDDSEEEEEEEENIRYANVQSSPIERTLSLNDINRPVTESSFELNDLPVLTSMQSSSVVPLRNGGEILSSPMTPRSHRSKSHSH